MTTAARIRDLILRELQWNGSADELTEDFPLIERRVIDSLDLMKLVSLLEEELGVEVPDEDLVASNFATIRDIASFVDRRLSR